jgi:hypothetical protein
MTNKLKDVLSLWHRILEIEVLHLRNSSVIKEYKQLKEFLNEEAKRKMGSSLPTWLAKSRKKQNKVWNKLTKEGYGKL